MPAFLLKRWKFQRDILARRMIITSLENYLFSFADVFSDIDVITFIPMHFLKKRFIRWVNIPEEIAAIISKHTNIPLIPMLSANLFKSEMHKIRRKIQRQQQIKGAFYVKSRMLNRLCRDKNALKILLVDDILTTGATFREASSVVKDICPFVDVKGFVLCA